MNKFTCECGSVCTIREKSRHFRSKKHLDFINKVKEPSGNIQVDNNADDINLTINDPFLEEFTNDKLINETIISNTETFNNYQKDEKNNIKKEHNNLKLEEKQIKLIKQKTKLKYYVKNLSKMKKKMIYLVIRQPKF
jgi:hypothetical protein